VYRGPYPRELVRESLHLAATIALIFLP